MNERDRDEGELVRRAAAGNRRAGQRLVMQHEKGLWLFLFRLSGSAVRAEELFQEPWVRGWPALGAFRGESSFRTYLLGVGRRVWADLGRPSARMAESIGAPEPAMELAPDRNLIAGEPSGLHPLGPGRRRGEETPFRPEAPVRSAIVLTLLLAFHSPGALGIPQATTPAGGPAPVPYQARRLTSAEALRDVRLLGETLRRVHPGFDRYASSAALEESLARLEDRASTGTTDVDLHLGIARLLATLRCAHTKAELPPGLVAHRNQVPSYLPFTFRLIEGRMLVGHTSDDSPLARGDEVVAINGRAVGTLVEEIAPYLSIDGWTDHAKRTELESSRELMGDAIDHFWPLLYGWPTSWTVDARRATDGTRADLELAPITHPEWLELAARDGQPDFGDAMRLRMLDERTALLAIDTFVNYRHPVDPVATLRPQFRTLKEEGVTHLILDLRACGGGSPDVPTALLAFLVDRPTVPAKRRPWVKTFRFEGLRPFLTTWEEGVFDLPPDSFRELPNGLFEMGPEIAPDALMAIAPHGDRFAGDLTVLVGAGNASGATNFLAVLREHRERVRLVGEATGGSAEGTTAGLIFFLQLPTSGITVRVPAIRSFNRASDFEPGFGVRPDVAVAETVASFRVGRDLVLEAARAPFADEPPPQRAATRRLRELFGGLHEKGTFHGAVLVAERGRIVYEDAFGLADDQLATPITPHTRFEIASVTKPLTAYAILMLRDEGRLGLDDPVVDHLPVFPYAGVTIRHLLTHTSGMPDHFQSAAALRAGGTIVDNPAVVSFLARSRPPANARPGTSFEYNNLGYVCLAEIIARVSGRPFAAFLRDRVFVPLGMTTARVYTTRWTEGEIVPELALPYVRAEDGTWVAPESTEAFAFTKALGGTVGDGGVIATVRDLLLFDEELRAPTLVRPETLAEALRPVVLADGEELWQQDWVKSSYGLGWRLEPDRTTFWHTGDWGGYLALMKRYTDSGRVIVYLQNRRATDWSWFGTLEAIMRSEGSLLD